MGRVVCCQLFIRSIVRQRQFLSGAPRTRGSRDQGVRSVSPNRRPYYLPSKFKQPLAEPKLCHTMPLWDTSLTVSRKRTLSVVELSGVQCTYLFIALLKFQSKSSFSMQKILRRLQMNFFEKWDLLDLLQDRPSQIPS